MAMSARQNWLCVGVQGPCSQAGPRGQVGDTGELGDPGAIGANQHPPRCRRRRGLQRLIDTAYQKRSVAGSRSARTCTHHGFDEQMPTTLATAPATVDRPLHHVHVGQTSGDSGGSPPALAGQG